MAPALSTTNGAPRASLAKDAGAPAERRPVEFAAAPASRVWMAICLAAGGAILAACIFYGFGELLLSVKRHVLEALFAAPSPS